MGVTVGCRQSNLVNTPSQRLSSLWSSSYIIAGHKKSVQLVHNIPSFTVRCSVSSSQVESRVAAVEQQSVKPECFGVFFLTYDLKTEEERQSLKKLITDAVSGAAGMISNHHLIQEKHTYLKFLVSNAFAGSVIGKGGSIITNFQKESGARIMLSGNQEFFPGTADRVIMLSGKIGDVLKAMDLILNRLLSEIQSEDGDDAEQRSKVRLVVPSSCCGAIIGKGGVTIKSFIEESGASISISPQEHNFIGLSDQIVTLAGSFEEQMQVIDLILSKLTEEQLYLQSMNAPLSYPIVPAAYNNYGPPNGGGGKYMNNNKEDRVSSLTIGLAAEHIGVVIGRGGRNISEICETSGASIKISERGDFMAGTSKRKVTITGSLKSIKAAEAMIKEKVDSVAEINEPLRGAIAR